MNQDLKDIFQFYRELQILAIGIDVYVESTISPADVTDSIQYRNNMIATLKSHPFYAKEDLTYDTISMQDDLRISLAGMDKAARIAILKSLFSKVDEDEYEISTHEFYPHSEKVKRLENSLTDDKVFAFCDSIFNALHWANQNVMILAKDFGIPINKITENEEWSEREEEGTDEAPSDGVKVKRAPITYLFFRLQEEKAINPNISGAKLGDYISWMTGYSPKQTRRKPCNLTEPAKEELRELLKKLLEEIK